MTHKFEAYELALVATNRLEGAGIDKGDLVEILEVHEDHLVVQVMQMKADLSMPFGFAAEDDLEPTDGKDDFGNPMWGPIPGPPVK